ncbi:MULTISPECIES: CPBP family intramembrane glutamic endopeptidase [Pseudomonas]|uniref:CAAX protease n=2 Tax=Pseudomonas TaxID=286 RepID=A0AA94EQL2_9PSED|nr:MULTISPECIES: type II CAAX endopeptidase family protein [Pseudomonas]MBT9267708.1 CPBP family intramembrane metalloprotease [Pseudomonas sp. MG-9]RVD78697.1 CAAX protease [Pseudomonas koreensis]WDR35706.1 CPBP family intramembrane metalloprotease [Pseudomonas serboccidentalis]
MQVSGGFEWRASYLREGWKGRASIAFLGFVLYWLMQVAGGYVFRESSGEFLVVVGAHLVACIVMVLLFCLLRRMHPIGNRFKGEGFSSKALWMGLASVALLYVASYAFSKWIGQPPEPFMQQFMSALQAGSIYNSGILLFLILVLAPLGEELAFRHFLINLFAFKKTFWRYAAILFSALLFTAIHWQYSFKTTLVSLFVLALMLAIARLATGGLLLPMIMHGFAGLLAVGLYPFFYS